MAKESKKSTHAATQAVRDAARASAASAMELLAAAEKLEAEAEQNEAYIADLDRKADLVRALQHEREQLVQDIEVKKKTLADLSDKLAALKAAIPS